MLKKFLVKTIMIAAVCGLVTTPAAKAGSATGVQKKSNAKVEKSHWGWNAGKVAGTGVGIVAGGIGGLFGIGTLLECLDKKNQMCKQWLKKETLGLDRGCWIMTVSALLMAAGAGYGGFKAVQLLQKKFAKPKAATEQKIAEQKVEPVVEQEQTEELPAEEIATED